jgi:hypothetical protein
VGYGFFITGDLVSRIAVECECCSCAFTQRLEVPVKVGPAVNNARNIIGYVSGNYFVVDVVACSGTLCG